MKISTFLLLVLLAFTVQGQNNITNIILPKSSTDTVIIDLRHKLYLEVAAINHGQLKLNLVDAISDSSKTIIAEFNSSTMGTTLSIKNPFYQTLTYKAAIFISKQNAYKETDVLPVGKNLMSFEMWGNGIKRIRLTDFQLKGNK